MFALTLTEQEQTSLSDPLAPSNWLLLRVEVKQQSKLLSVALPPNRGTAARWITEEVETLMLSNVGSNVIDLIGLFDYGLMIITIIQFYGYFKQLNFDSFYRQ